MTAQAQILNFLKILKTPCRRPAATRLADAGVSTETRKRILGHTTDENADRYDHAAHIDETRAAMEAAADK